MFKLMTLGYLKKGGKTLMLHRVKKDNDLHHGKWNGLGGKFEPGETPEECIIREILEETNGEIIVRNPKLKGRIVFQDVLPGSLNNAHMYIFVLDEFEGCIKGDSSEGRLAWVEDDDVLSLNLWDGDRTFLPWLKEEGFFSAKLVYEGENLIGHSVTFYK